MDVWKRCVRKPQLWNSLIFDCLKRGLESWGKLILKKKILFNSFATQQSSFSKWVQEVACWPPMKPRDVLNEKFREGVNFVHALTPVTSILSTSGLTFTLKHLLTNDNILLRERGAFCGEGWRTFPGEGWGSRILTRHERSNMESCCHGVQRLTKIQ